MSSHAAQTEARQPLLIKALRAAVLPPEVSEFERSYLVRMNRIARLFFYAHLPLLAVLAGLNGVGIASSTLLTLAVLSIPFLSERVLTTERAKSLTHGFTAMCMGGVLVHVGQGPVQIEMHFYFFSLLAMLAIFGNPMVVVVAAGTVALHHLALWYLAPASVFNYDAPLWVVLVHAAFVVLETVAAGFIARNFFDNVIGLEKKVQERTAEVDARNRDMRLVLDSVRQGLVTVELDGRMSAETSAALIDWFGDAEAGLSFSSYISPHSEEFGRWFELSLESLLDGFMPVEVALDQFPRSLSTDGRHFSFSYESIEGEDGSTAKVLVVVSDITADVERAEAESRERDVQSALQRIAQDRAGFLNFRSEAHSLIPTIAKGIQESAPGVKPALHTLKGNAATMGLESLSQACHELESALAECDAAEVEAGCQRIESFWNHIEQSIESVLGDLAGNAMVIDVDQYHQLVDAVQSEATYEELAIQLAGLSMEPTTEALERLAAQAQRIASRLSKEALELEIHGSELRVHKDHFRPFWGALVHVLRNAIDHGLESAEERQAAGKPSAGRLQLSTYIENSTFVVEIRDDGRGICWDDVERRVQELGLSDRFQGDMVAALFHEGLSTRSEVSETSGRGVGLGAVVDACEELGGTISINSQQGSFTSFCFKFPTSNLTGQLLASGGVATSGVHQP